MTKDELLASIRRDRARLDALVESLDERQLVVRELDDGWAVKDVIAHITGWEQLCLKWIREDRRDAAWFTQESRDALNAAMHDEHSCGTLALTLAAARNSHNKVEALVESLDDARLAATPTWASGGDAATTGRTLGDVISSNSDEHYREHVEQIARWVATSEGA